MNSVRYLCYAIFIVIYFYFRVNFIAIFIIYNKYGYEIYPEVESLTRWHEEL